jgi:chromosome segregation protein
MKFLHAQSAYLELRAAAVDDDAAKAELLPCIADDMLIAFDDVRAAAAVALLARLGQISQVILFTHHDPIAARTDGQAGLAVQCSRSSASPPC